MLATREAEDGDFYAGRENRAAAIAHFKTVEDTYPLYSRMDEVLIALGDQYEAQARAIRMQPLPEGAKAILEKENHDKAAEAYDKVVLEHAASAHVEDAKDRLAAMDRPIPVPTPEQLAASTALESSRSAYTITDRAALLFLHRPDVVQAARVGQPTLTDPRPTLAPDVITEFREDYMAALNGKESPSAAKATEDATAATPASPAAAGDAPAGSLTLEDVPTARVSNNGSSTTMVTGAPSTTTSGSGGSHVGLSIVTPTSPSSAPATPEPGMPAMGTVGPTDNKPLPPIEKAAAPPEQTNEIQPGTSQGTTNSAAPATGKKSKAKKAPVDTSQESSSKKKPRKGLGKLNPF
jgi:outer membrane protein assembly factor BamD